MTKKNYLETLKKRPGSLHFPLLVYSVPGQIEGGKKAFLERKAQVYPLNYHLYVGLMLAVTKGFIILFLLCLWEQGTSQQFSKQMCKLSFQLSVQIYSPFGQTEEERKAFFGGCKKGGGVVRLTPRVLVVIKDEKVCPFVKFEIIIPLLCCLLDPLTNYHYRAWSSMINLWIDSRTCQKHIILLSARQRCNNYFQRKISKENVLGNTMLSH